MNIARRCAIVALVGAVSLAVTIASIQAQSALATRSNSAGGVTVVVKPKVVTGATWEFEVTMDTHTKPLDDDLTKTAALVDSGGARSTPIAWQGDKPGGHHRKGVLRFAAPAKIDAFELQMAGPGGTAQRVFKWTR